MKEIKELFVTEKVSVAELVPHTLNPRKIKQLEKGKLWARLQKFGLIGIPVRDADGTMLSGHQRCQVLRDYGMGDMVIDVRTAVRKLTDVELKEIMVIENTHAGEFDLQMLHDQFEEYVNLDDFNISMDELTKDLDTGKRSMCLGAIAQGLDQYRTLPMTNTPGKEKKWDVQCHTLLKRVANWRISIQNPRKKKPKRML